MFRPLRIATCASLVTLCGGFAATVSAAELKVVASFSIIGDFARNVGGDRIEVTTLVGPNGDAHVYEPRPADAAALEQADVVLVNGLAFEGFMSRLVETSGTKAAVVEVSEGIEPLKASGEEHHEGEGTEEAGRHDDGHDGEADHHGEFDPHAWQSIHNAEIYVKNIAGALCEADASGCATYTANSETYLKKLTELEAEVKAAFEAIPADKRTIITSHDAFGYFEHAYGLKFIAPEGISTEAEASAADVARLIDQVKEDKASAIFLENITNPRLVERDGDRDQARRHALFGCALGRGRSGFDYIDMFRHNVNTIKAAILDS